jgi:hypothetical protein
LVRDAGGREILYSSTQFMPQILQANFGYTATWAGLSLMPGGFTALFHEGKSAALCSRAI